MASLIPRTPAIIVALVNNKGGVGKTTTAVNLAAAVAHSRKKCLLIDLDSQASASLFLGVRKADLAPSSADVLLEGRPLQGAIRETSNVCLNLVTGSRALSNADLVLAPVKGREYRLKAALEAVRPKYSYIILDCPPSMSLLTVNALVGSDAYIIPVTPQYLALEGLVTLVEAVDRVRAATGMGGTLLGVVLTMVDARMKSAVEINEMIRGHYKGLVFNTEIRMNAKLAEAPSFGQTILEYAPASAAADAHQRLAGEFLQRAQHAFKI
jgi:chromosome partitioning protein